MVEAVRFRAAPSVDSVGAWERAVPLDPVALFRLVSPIAEAVDKLGVGRHCFFVLALEIRHFGCEAVRQVSQNANRILGRLFIRPRRVVRRLVHSVQQYRYKT